MIRANFRIGCDLGPAHSFRCSDPVLGEDLLLRRLGTQDATVEAEVAVGLARPTGIRHQKCEHR